jgi:UDP-glucose 4-epimerase
MGELMSKNFVITGGAGFIGSHILEALMNDEANVCVFDNLSTGNFDNIKRHIKNHGLTFIRGDLRNMVAIAKAVEHCEIVFHLAANPEIRISSFNPQIHYQQNVGSTFNLLEAVRKAGDVETFVFASSSTVYGEPATIPTPEDYATLEPISVYGATKLACEALITAYAHTYGFKAIMYRLANIVGPRNKHGVVHDFIKKLKTNPQELEILGDGTQTKSYLYITDCIEAMFLGLKRTSKQVEIYNVGSEDQIDVKTIAELAVKEIGLRDVKFKFTSGIDGGRGWKGDVKNMLLDITKLKSLGWKPRLNSKQSIKKAIKCSIKEATQKSST